MRRSFAVPLRCQRASPVLTRLSSSNLWQARYTVSVNLHRIAHAPLAGCDGMMQAGKPEDKTVRSWVRFHSRNEAKQQSHDIHRFPLADMIGPSGPRMHRHIVHAVEWQATGRTPTPPSSRYCIQKTQLVDVGHVVAPVNNRNSLRPHTSQMRPSTPRRARRCRPWGTALTLPSSP